MGSARTCVSTLLALFLPPVAVFIARGCGCQLLLNIILTILGFLPGMIHALFVICMTDDDDDSKGLPFTNPEPVPVAAPAVPHPHYPQGAHPAPMAGQPMMAPPQHPGHNYPAVPPPGPYGTAPAGYPEQQGYPPQPKA